MILAGLDNLWLFLIIIGAFGLIAVVAFILYRLLRPKLKQPEPDKEKTEQDYAKEELDRLLQPVEDEKVSREIQSFEQKDDDDE